MAGKHEITLNRNPRYVNSTLPSSKGADYWVDANPAGDLKELNFRRLGEAMRSCNLESNGLTIRGEHEIKQGLRYCAEQLPKKIEDSIFVLTLTKHRLEHILKLHIHPEISHMRDETELFGNACVILDHALEYIENEKNYTIF